MLSRHTTLFLAILVFCPTLVADDTFRDAPQTMELVEILRSDASTFEKAKACQQLGVIGDEAAVDALASLMDDPKLSSYAISAIGRIPGADVDSAMVDAVQNLSGRPLVGLCDAIGQRRIPSAVDSIGRRLDSGDLDDDETRAAIRSLGDIGNADAISALRRVRLDGASELTRRLHRVALQKYQWHSRRQFAETPSSATARLSRQLDGDDASFSAALMLAREVGAPASGPLAEKLPGMNPRRQSLALICLAELGNPASLAAARDLIDSDDDEVAIRAAHAVAALGGIDGRTGMPAFISDRPLLASARMPSIVKLANQQIDDDVLQTLTGLADQKIELPPALQIAYVEYAAARRLSSATPALLRLASSNNSQVRQTALAAAGLTVDAGQFPDLIRHATSQDVDSTLAIESIQKACVHLPQDAAAEALGAAVEAANKETKLLLLKQLAFLGGPAALDMVTEVADRGDEASIDFATQVLGEWTTADVAPALLKLADGLPKGKYRLRALRGYLRVGRQLAMEPAERLQLCENGWARAQRDDERILVLDVIRRFPNRDAMVWLCQLIRNNEMPSRPVSNRALSTLAHAAGRVAISDPETVSDELATIDLSKAPAQVRQTLEDLRQP